MINSNLAMKNSIWSSEIEKEKPQKLSFKQKLGHDWLSRCKSTIIWALMLAKYGPKNKREQRRYWQICKM